VLLTHAFQPLQELAIHGNITLAYPLIFFAVGVVPFVAIDATSVPGLRITCSQTSHRIMIMTIGSKALPVSFFIV
jgi:hypothetical protein